MSSSPSASNPSRSETEQSSRREFLRRATFLGLAGVGGGTLFAACGGSGSDGSSSTAESSGGAGSTSGTASKDADRTVTIHPKGNQMKYKETEFTVAPGETIKLVFENTATSPSMQHNVVVLTEPPKQQFFKKVGQAGMQAGSSNDYVPTDMGDLILAHTPISKPGETVSVTFTAPSQTGDYGYVCTFPGHWATMQGTMHVEKGAA